MCVAVSLEAKSSGGCGKFTTPVYACGYLPAAVCLQHQCLFVATYLLQYVYSTSICLWLPTCCSMFTKPVYACGYLPAAVC